MFGLESQNVALMLKALNPKMFTQISILSGLMVSSVKTSATGYLKIAWLENGDIFDIGSSLRATEISG